MVSSDSPLQLLQAWIEHARSQGAVTPDVVMLSTSSRNAEPSARVVTIKLIEEDSLVFTSRDDTRKARDLADNSRCALTYWWPEVGRQVRLACAVGLVEADQRDALFAARPRTHQIATVVSPQGRELSDLEMLRDRAVEFDEEHAGRNIPCPDWFIAYRVIPHTIEFWQQAADRLHERVEYRLQEKLWHRRLLAP